MTEPTAAPKLQPVEMYCVKCLAKRTITDPELATTVNGRPMRRGKCPVCGTTVVRMGAPK